MAHTMTFDDEQAEVWSEWQDHIPRRYDQLGDRVMELVALDLQCYNETGVGLAELFERNQDELLSSCND